MPFNHVLSIETGVLHKYAKTEYLVLYVPAPVSLQLYRFQGMVVVGRVG